MSYTPSYPQRINFENDPSTATPLNQTNLNKMDNAIYQHDRALSAQDERISDLESEDKVTSFKGRTGVVTPADDDYTIAQIKATGSEGQIPALNSQGKFEMVTPNKAGHDIVDKVGNVMTTRDNLQFVGAVSVTDDSTNNKTIVNVTGGGGGGGGHVIEDNDGTDMPQEDNLQFVGAYTEDDATNDRTKVNIVREMTSTQMQSLTTAQKKGFIHTTDEPDNPLNVRGYAEVIADGEKTYSSLLNSLYALLDLSKITESSVLLLGSTIYHLMHKGASPVFSHTIVGYDGANYSITINTFILSATSKGQGAVISSTATYRDLGILKPSNGTKISMVY